MWEYINGEAIFMDKEMGADEYERQNAKSSVSMAGGHGGASDGTRLSKGDIAVGVAGGMIGAKVASRVWGWFWWMVAISAFLLTIM